MTPPHSKAQNYWTTSRLKQTYTIQEELLPKPEEDENNDEELFKESEIDQLIDDLPSPDD